LGKKPDSEDRKREKADGYSGKVAYRVSPRKSKFQKRLPCKKRPTKSVLQNYFKRLFLPDLEKPLEKEEKKKVFWRGWFLNRRRGVERTPGTAVKGESKVPGAAVSFLKETVFKRGGARQRYGIGKAISRRKKVLREKR